MPNLSETRVCLAYATRNEFVNYQEFALLFDVHKSINPEPVQKMKWLKMCPTIWTGVLSQSSVGPQRVTVGVSMNMERKFPEKENERQTWLQREW